MPSYTTRLMKRLPVAGDGLTPETYWTDDWHDNEKIDEVVLSALLSGNRVSSGGAVTAGAGLVVNYTALVAAVAGISFSIAAGNKTCTAAAAGQELGNWLYISSAGVVTISTTPPAGDYVPLARIDASDTAVLRIADLRPRAVTSSGHRNKLRNGDFSVNQRAVSGTVVLAAGARGHDMWKAGGTGCTYTFATVLNVTTITISAGSLVQVVEGLFLQSGVHCLSWGGNAQARIDGGSMAASGLTATAVGGTNMTIEFGTGTVQFVQLERGDRPSLFEFRLNELGLCQRYLPAINAHSAITYLADGFAATPTTARLNINFKVEPRILPTGFLATAANMISLYDGSSAPQISSALSVDLYAITGCRLVVTTTGLTAHWPYHAWINTLNAKLLFLGAEL